MENSCEDYLREALLLDARSLQNNMRTLRTKILLVMNFVEKNEEKLVEFGLHA